MPRPARPHVPSDPTPMVCTVQPHVTGGYTPIAHLLGTPPPAPGPWALTFPTVPEAVRWAKNHYGVTRVEVSTSSQPAA